MKQLKPLLLLISTAALALPLIFSQSAAAVDSSDISISVSPGQQRLSLSPGETKTAEITVINSGSTEYEVRVYATTYEVAPDYSQNIFENPATTRSQISRWVSFSGQTETPAFKLAPNARQTVEFTITVPASVPAGGQYAAIMAEVIPPANAAGVVTIRRVASLLHSNIDGNTIEQGAVTERSWRGFSSSRDIDTSLVIQNSGNTDFSAENRLIIQNIFGKFIDEITEPSKLVFPDTSRKFELNWQSKSPVGIYKLTQQSQFLGQIISETKLIFVIPIWFTILIVIILTAAITSIIIFVKKKQRNKNLRNRYE